MGIDVYLRWDKMTKQDKEAQYTGFDITSGRVGYLREAYHGPPYATHVLISEPWEEQPKDGFVIPNEVLRERLPAARDACLERYNGDSIADEAALSYDGFVELHREKEEAGLNPRIIVSY